MSQRIYPQGYLSLCVSITETQWAELEAAAGKPIKGDLRVELERILNAYLSSKEAFQESFPAKVVRAELEKIKKALGYLRKYVRERTGETLIEDDLGLGEGAFTAGLGTMFVMDDNDPQIRLTRCAIQELQLALWQEDSAIDVEKVFEDAINIYSAADQLTKKLSGKTGRTDDYHYDVFVYDTTTALKRHLEIKPHSKKIYKFVWQLTQIARKHLRPKESPEDPITPQVVQYLLRQQGVTDDGIAALSVGETAMQQRIKDARRAEKEEG